MGFLDKLKFWKKSPAVNEKLSLVELLIIEFKEREVALRSQASDGDSITRSAKLHAQADMCAEICEKLQSLKG